MRDNQYLQSVSRAWLNSMDREAVRLPLPVWPRGEALDRAGPMCWHLLEDIRRDGGSGPPTRCDALQASSGIVEAVAWPEVRGSGVLSAGAGW